MEIGCLCTNACGLELGLHCVTRLSQGVGVRVGAKLLWGYQHKRKPTIDFKLSIPEVGKRWDLIEWAQTFPSSCLYSFIREGYTFREFAFTLWIGVSCTRLGTSLA